MEGVNVAVALPKWSKAAYRAGVRLLMGLGLRLNTGTVPLTYVSKLG
jgi:hypothetical protein